MGKKVQDIELIKHDLELDEDIPLHRTGWIIQRIGWGVLYTGLILAMLGLFGTGLLSQRKQEINGNELSYERFLRFEAEAQLTFKISDARDSIILIVPQRYTEHIDITAINPLPAKSVITNGQVVYSFPASGHGEIHCTLMAKKPGRITETIIANNSAFTLSHLIYP